MPRRTTRITERADRDSALQNYGRPALLGRLAAVGLTAFLSFGWISFSAQAETLEKPLTGEQIYRKHCERCHGDRGQGVPEEYDEPLYGDRSIQSLTRRITRTMPEDDPDLCVGDDAQRVAEFIYHAFYSPEARQKHGLIPRVELSRLTVSQYRNAVADIVSWFTPNAEILREFETRQGLLPPLPTPEPGLRAEVFQSKGMSKANERKDRRIDSRIEFDFGEGSPHPDITADQFAIIWEGALNAPDTGDYEFRVTTQNGARLYLNSENTGQRRRLRDDSSVAGQAALIDAWVSSGKLREESARVFLLGGRRYPLRFEFFKYKEETASVKLEWRTPDGVWRVLDDRATDTGSPARTFVVDTSFPADDRSTGYERGASVSPEWHAAVMRGASATATEVVNRLPMLAAYRKGEDASNESLREFVARFARIAFRRPLTPREERIFRQDLFGSAESPEAAVRRGILLILKSPHFLYLDLTPEDERPSPYAVAARLSFAMLDSIPDPVLLRAVGEGRLSTPEAVEAQAERLLQDPRARAKLRTFFHEWLEIGERDLAKDKSRYPEFDEQVVADLRESLEQFIDDVVWSSSSDYRQLLLSNELFLNDALTALYADHLLKADAEAEADAGETGAGASVTAEGSHRHFVPVSFPKERRSGLLTHPYLLSAFAYHNNTSPIHRGVFLTQNVIGRGLRPPPEAVAFKEDEFDPELTMREKITQLTRDTACMSCHSIINPLGFALENFDAVGRWRTMERDKPIDPVSEYLTREGETVRITSARDIAEFAVGSEAAHQAFVTQFFHHLVKQDPAAYGPETAAELRLRFQRDQFNVQHLMARIAATTAIHGLQRAASNLASHDKH